MISDQERKTSAEYFSDIGDKAGFKDNIETDSINLVYVTDDNVYDKDVNNYNFASITEKFNDLIEGNIKNIFNSIYPVGSIYMTFSYNQDPNTLFGGKWERLDEGIFLRNTQKNEQGKGGNETITLEVNQLPGHTHPLPDLGHTHTFKINHWHPTASSDEYKYALVNANIYFTDKRTWTTPAATNNNGFHYLGTNADVLKQDKIAQAFADERKRTGNVYTGNVDKSPTYNPDFKTNSIDPASNKKTEPTGSGNAINILPPYQTVYMWKRTA